MIPADMLDSARQEMLGFMTDLAVVYHPKAHSGTDEDSDSNLRGGVRGDRSTSQDTSAYEPEDPVPCRLQLDLRGFKGRWVSAGQVDERTTGELALPYFVEEGGVRRYINAREDSRIVVTKHDTGEQFGFEITAVIHQTDGLTKRYSVSEL